MSYFINIVKIISPGLLWLYFGILALGPQVASALPPLEMLYCGNVTDTQSRPFKSGQFILRILEENGTALWTSSSVTPSFSSNGDFCITLGRDTEPLTTSIFSGDDSLFLEISFRGDGYSSFETLYPLTPLVYAPFAVVSANSSSSDESGSSDSDSIVEGTDGLEIATGNLTLSTGDLILTEGDIEASAGIISASSVSAGNLTVDSGTLVIDSANDRVGIGTSSPQTGLDIAKNVLITPTTTTGTGILIDASSVTSGVVLDIDAQGNLTGGGNALRIKYDSNKTGSSGKIFVIRDVKSGSDVFYVDGSGNVRASGIITLSQGSVSTTEIADSSVTTAKIVDATIATADLADSAISTAKIASDAITSAKITDATIATADLADSSVTTAKINDNTISSSDLAATLTFADGDLLDLSAINASSTSEGLKLPQATDVSAATAEGQISWDTDNDILYVGSGSAVISFSSSIDSSDITDGTIVAADIADSAITSAKILDGTIAAGDLASNSVTSAKISDGTITTDDIADGTIANADIGASAAIATSKLSGAVTSIASHGLGTLATASAVGSAEITDASIATADIADSAITGAKIFDATITSGDIANGTIVNANINTTAAIALSKLASGTSAQIIVGDGTGVPTYVALSGDATISNAGALSIASNVINQDELAATITLADSDFINMASINASGTGEGLRLPQATDVSAATAEGQISWDTDDDRLYIGTGSAVGSIVHTPFPAAIQTGLSGTDGQLKIYSEQGATDYTITINPHATMTADTTYTLPANDGTAGDFLQSDGSGALSWIGSQSGNQGAAYNPNNPPSTANALDDEFNDSSLNAKWTEWNLGSASYTITEANHLLKVNVPTNNPYETAGIYQALPDGFGDFTLVTKVSITGSQTNYLNMGLMTMQGTTNNSDIAALAFSYRNTNGPIMIWAGNLTDYLAGAGTTYPKLYNPVYFTSVYLRMRRTGTTLIREYSLDGIGFFLLDSSAEPFTPVNVGLFWGNDNSGKTFDVYFEFFRYKGSDDSGLIGSW
ncbi:MAG: hypothetical protein HY538_04805 [Deltaproteobacteria bacterium]|nr:hypothetical protein [Deltaproteobacteria bacterium]